MLEELFKLTRGVHARAQQVTVVCLNYRTISIKMGWPNQEGSGQLTMTLASTAHTQCVCVQGV